MWVQSSYPRGPKLLRLHSLHSGCYGGHAWLALKPRKAKVNDNTSLGLTAMSPMLRSKAKVLALGAHTPLASVTLVATAGVTVGVGG